MVFKDYLQNKNLTPARFARKAGITKVSLSLFLNGLRGLSAATMAKIVAATEGEVTYEDLVAEMLDLHAARKKKNGSIQPEQQETVPPGI